MTWCAKMNIHCKYDELVDVKALRPHPKNRNKHPDDQIERLAKILKYQGVRAPIVVSNRSNKIVKGHGTLQAIKANQWDKAPVVYQDFEDDDQEWLFVQSDNAIASWAELDLKGINADIGELGPFDIDLIGIKDFVVEPAEKDLGDEEAVPEARETNIKLGDLFILGDHKLLCGDSTDSAQVERLMNGEKADMVFTDPPYNYKKMGLGGGCFEKHNKKLVKSIEHISFFDPTQFLLTLKLLMNEHFCAYIFCNVELVENYLSFARKEKFSKNILTWHKKTTIPNTWNHHLPDTEYCIFISKKPIWNNGLSIEHYKKYWIEESVKENIDHPTPKPVKIIVLGIELNSKINGIVVDLFGGSGSTLIACEKTNRKCFMMELDPQYCQVIIDRWEQYTGKKAVKHG